MRVDVGASARAKTRCINHRRVTGAKQCRDCAIMYIRPIHLSPASQFSATPMTYKMTRAVILLLTRTAFFMRYVTHHRYIDGGIVKYSSKIIVQLLCGARVRVLYFCISEYLYWKRVRFPSVLFNVIVLVFRCSYSSFRIGPTERVRARYRWYILIVYFIYVPKLLRA